MWSRRALVTLLAIVVVGAGLRLWRPGSSPPGINQDEATSVWNSHCILKTGADQSGARWPIFSARCFGDSQTTLFLYYLIPFEAIGGASIDVARLAVAMSGIAALLLIAYIASRMFNPSVALVAAALLALNPWHVQQCRWAHDATFTPFLVALAWAALIWAGLPIGAHAGDAPRAGRAALAGAAFGIASYGYVSIRFFLPLFLIAIIAITWKSWVALATTRRGKIAIAAMLASWFAIFAPLAWTHLTDPVINKRALNNWVWDASDSVTARVAKVLGRYAAHFDPRSLFVHSKMLDFISPPKSGYLNWYLLPLLAIGILVLALKIRKSPAHRVLVAALLLYPAGDCVNSAADVHPLRSLPGIYGLFLVAAVGAVEGVRWLRARAPRAAWIAVALVATIAAAEHVRGYRAFFGEFNRRPWTIASFHTDLVEACDWLRPRLDEADAVFITTSGMNMPYVVTMVALGYDPRQWFRDERRTFTIEPWEYQSRVGKIYFMYTGRDDVHDAAWDALVANAKPDRVIVIARPGEVDLAAPAHTITDSKGRPRLSIYETTL